MENKITKILIVVLGVIIFSYAFANSVSAAYNPIYAFSNNPVTYHDNSAVEYAGNGYYNYNPQPYYYQYPVAYNTVNPVNTTTAKPTTSVVNNYYYQTAPVKTVTSTPVVEAKTDEVNSQNNLGASAYDSQKAGNGITALSLRGSGSFMPSSIWQWIFTVILILVIIIIARTFVHKPTPGEHSHAH